MKLVNVIHTNVTPEVVQNYTHTILSDLADHARSRKKKASHFVEAAETIATQLQKNDMASAIQTFNNTTGFNLSISK